MQSYYFFYNNIFKIRFLFLWPCEVNSLLFWNLLYNWFAECFFLFTPCAVYRSTKCCARKKQSYPTSSILIVLFLANQITFTLFVSHWQYFRILDDWKKCFILAYLFNLSFSPYDFKLTAKKASKFRDWLDCSSMEIKPNAVAMEILAYLAYETVAQVRQCADSMLATQNELITLRCASASGDCGVCPFRSMQSLIQLTKLTGFLSFTFLHDRCVL